jgi:hypothetical protein
VKYIFQIRIRTIKLLKTVAAQYTGVVWKGVEDTRGERGGREREV